MGNQIRKVKKVKNHRFTSFPVVLILRNGSMQQRSSVYLQSNFHKRYD